MTADEQRRRPRTLCAAQHEQRRHEDHRQRSEQRDDGQREGLAEQQRAGGSPCATRISAVPRSRSPATAPAPRSTSASGTSTCSTKAGDRSPKRASCSPSREAAKVGVLRRWPSRKIERPVKPSTPASRPRPAARSGTRSGRNGPCGADAGPAARRIVVYCWCSLRCAASVLAVTNCWPALTSTSRARITSTDCARASRHQLRSVPRRVRSRPGARGGRRDGRLVLRCSWSCRAPLCCVVGPGVTGRVGPAHGFGVDAVRAALEDLAQAPVAQHGRDARRRASRRRDRG